MSGSTARKVQPFTISTKLSLPKCAAEFSADSCPGIALASALDGRRGLRAGLEQRISLYLAQARAGPREQPRGTGSGTGAGPAGGGEEERVSRGALARSIKRITLSNWHGGDAGAPRDPARVGGERNHNNNNSGAGTAHVKVSAPRVRPCGRGAGSRGCRDGCCAPLRFWRARGSGPAGAGLSPGLRKERGSALGVRLRAGSRELAPPPPPRFDRRGNRGREKGSDSRRPGRGRCPPPGAGRGLAAALRAPTRRRREPRVRGRGSRCGATAARGSPFAAGQRRESRAALCQPLSALPIKARRSRAAPPGTRTAPGSGRGLPALI